MDEDEREWRELIRRLAKVVDGHSWLYYGVSIIQMVTRPTLVDLLGALAVAVAVILSGAFFAEQKMLVAFVEISALVIGAAQLANALMLTLRRRWRSVDWLSVVETSLLSLVALGVAKLATMAGQWLLASPYWFGTLGIVGCVIVAVAGLAWCVGALVMTTLRLSWVAVRAEAVN